MDFLNYFFRSQPDGYIYEKLSLNHILILVITLLGCYLIIRFRDYIKSNRTILLTIKYGIIGTLAIQQIVLYLWYAFSGYRVFSEGLPLFNSRLAIIATALGLLFENKFLETLSCYWGIFASILALVSPGVDPFAFPHYTSISYFIGHMVLAWGTTFIFTIEDFKYTKTNLKQILIFTNIYHIIIFIFNCAVGSNYCYLNRTPIALGADWSQFRYTFIVMMVYNFAMCISYIVIKRRSKDVEEDEKKIIKEFHLSGYS